MSPTCILPLAPPMSQRLLVDSWSLTIHTCLGANHAHEHSHACSPTYSMHPHSQIYACSNPVWPHEELKAFLFLVRSNCHMESLICPRNSKFFDRSGATTTAEQRAEYATLIPSLEVLVDSGRSRFGTDVHGLMAHELGNVNIYILRGVMAALSMCDSTGQKRCLTLRQMLKLPHLSPRYP